MGDNKKQQNRLGQLCLYLRTLCGLCLIWLGGLASHAQADSDWPARAVAFAERVFENPPDIDRQRHEVFERKIQNTTTTFENVYWRDLTFRAALSVDNDTLRRGISELEQFWSRRNLPGDDQFLELIEITRHTLDSGEYAEGVLRIDTLLSELENNPELQIKALISKAYFLYWSNRPLEAAELVRTATRIADKADIRALVLAEIVSAEAFIYFKLDDPDIVLDALIHEFDLLNELGLPYTQYENLFNIGLLLNLHDELEAARRISDLFLENVDKPFYGTQQFDTYYLCGAVHSRLNDHKAALDCFLQGEPYLPETEAQSAAWTKLVVKAALNSGNTEVAREYFPKLADFPTFTSSAAERLDVALIEADLLSQEGRHEDAGALLHNIIRTSLDQINADNRRTTQNQLKYLKEESQRLEDRALLLEKQNRLQTQTVRLFQSASVLFALLVILATGFLIFMYFQEKEVRRARDHARQMSDVKTRFLANMSHEVRTPMNGVLGFADLLGRTDLSAKQAELVSLIKRSGTLLTKILDDILDVSRIEADEIQIRPVSFHPAELMEETRLFFETSTERSELTLTFSSTFDEGLEVLGDRARIRQVLFNLISNALKFTERGSVTVEAVAERCEENKLVLQFSIRDDGPGIPADFMPKVFDAFAQADASTTRQYEGIGVGLSICKQLVDRMEGQISLTSEPGSGTLARFSIPVEKLSASSDVKSQRATDTEQTGINALRILVAEDHPMNRRIVDLFMTDLGVTPVFAEDGRKAVDLYRSQVFDLVLLDIQMPEMNGIEALKAMRDIDETMHRPHPRYLAFTANVMTHHIEEYEREGFDGILTKPIEPDALLKAMDLSRAA